MVGSKRGRASVLREGDTLVVDGVDAEIILFPLWGVVRPICEPCACKEDVFIHSSRFIFSRNYEICQSIDFVAASLIGKNAVYM